MKISGINLNNNFGKINIEQTCDKPTIETVNNKTVCSPQAADAIMVRNNIEKTPYTFLQNINIPALNLNGNLYVLPNGQKCFVAQKDGPCIIKTFFKVGSMNENDNIRGISHYIEHNLFNGSKTLKPAEFVDKVTKMGGNYNASTSMNLTDYYIKSPLHKSDDLEKFIQMHADMLSHPSFTNETLDKEKGVVIKEIQMYEDNPNDIASNTTMKNLFNIKTNSNNIIGGSVKNIQNLTRDDVIKYYKTYYNPSNAITVVIGDIDEKETIGLLSKHFANFKTGENLPEKFHETLTPIQSPIRQDIFSSKTRSNVIQLAFSGPKNEESKTAVNALLTSLIGYKNAKLNSALKKFNIEADAMLEQMSNRKNSPNCILLGTNVAGDKSEDVLKTIYQSIHEMRYKPLTQDELNIVKGKMLSQLKSSSEDNADITAMLGANYINQGNFNNTINLEKEINALTAEDIMLAAKKYLDLNKVSICVVHPENTNTISFSGKKKILSDVKTYQTQNNAKISIQNIPAAKLHAINFELTSDKIPKKSPLIAIYLYMLKFGTSQMSEEEFSNIHDKNNITNLIETDYNKVKFKYQCSKEALPIVMDCFHKNFYSPALTQENFEKAKNEIRNIYLAMQKNPADKALETIFAGTPKGFSLSKIFEELDSVTLDDVIKYHNEFSENPQISITSTGDFSDNNTLNTIYYSISQNGKIYNSNEIKSNLNIKPLEKTQVVTQTQECNQANIVQMFKIEETGNIKDAVAINLLNEILGGNSNSRLFNDLREKQKLAYRVNSNYSLDNETDNIGILTLKIGTTTDDKNNPKQFENLQKAINGFNNHINKLINEKISDEELNSAKIMLKSRLLSAAETTFAKNTFLANAMNSLYKDKYFEKAFEAIDNAKSDDIQKIAKYYLSKPSVISIVASKDTLEKNAEYLKNIN